MPLSPRFGKEAGYAVWPLVIAVGVNQQGEREILGFDVG